MGGEVITAIYLNGSPSKEGVKYEFYIHKTYNQGLVYHQHSFLQLPHSLTPLPLFLSPSFFLSPLCFSVSVILFY